MNLSILLIFSSLKLSNRLINVSEKTGYRTLTGEVTLQHKAYYGTRAKGGFSEIINKTLFIDFLVKEHPKK